MTAFLLCVGALVGVGVVAIVVGGCILSGCLGMSDTQPDDWTNGEDEG